jgi:serine/threonine protein kinase
MDAPWRDAVLAGGKYALVEEIGRGGMGSVWRAHAVLLDRPCAIKFLRPEHATQAQGRERFVREARAAAKLRSNHVVTIFDVDYFNGVPFIAMELLTGESLECRLDRGTLSPEFTLQVIRQIASGLGKAHQAGLVHRDLKPDNVFLVEEDPLLVKILDFGVAKNVSTLAMHRTASGAIVGTPYYMSPEQATGKLVDLRSDVWALGVLTFRCLTGTLPFDGEHWPEVLLKIVQGKLPLPSRCHPGVSPAIDRWWKGAMRRDPTDRPNSAEALVDGFELALKSARPRQSQARGSSESSIRMRLAKRVVGVPGPRAIGWRLGIAVLGVLGLGVSAYFGAQPRRQEVVSEAVPNLGQSKSREKRQVPPVSSPPAHPLPPTGKDLPAHEPTAQPGPAVSPLNSVVPAHGDGAGAIGSTDSSLAATEPATKSRGSKSAKSSRRVRSTRGRERRSRMSGANASERASDAKASASPDRDDARFQVDEKLGF